jgi:hypothetical protein
MCGKVGDVRAFEYNISYMGGCQADDGSHCGCLAYAISADQGNALSCLNVK